MRRCSVDECEKKHEAKGYCNTHYVRLKRYGTVELTSPSLEKRFNDNYLIDITTGCWIWMGYLNSGGYGSFYVDGQLRSAHRVSWELHYGPIPEGLNVCHHCDVPGCVNPDHLFVGTQKDNIRDALNKGRLYLDGLKLGPIACKKKTKGGGTP